MFDRYTETARRAVFFARYEASQAGSPYIEPEHLLLGILREEARLLEPFLRSPAKLQSLCERIRRQFPPRQKIAAHIDLPVSAGSKRVFQYAAEEAKQFQQKHIGAEHLLLGVSREESSTAAQLLRENGVATAQLRDEIIHQSTQPGPAAPEEAPPPGVVARDLVEAARKGDLGPLIGRDRELERIVHILSRRTKNNPVLIGGAGVGKTALVNGLASRIAAGEAPLTLAGRRIVAVDASSLTAPRQRDRQLEPLFLTGNAILFVRGLFNLAAAGSAWAVVEAMHALEPHLASGEIQCIATGSPAGLRETLDKAGMLARHFEVVDVPPVSEQDAVRIVSGLKTQFERFHGVTFAQDAIETAVAASGRFLPDRNLPDRAIDLIDEAAAAVRLRRERAIAHPDDAANNAVTADDIEAAVAARVGVPLAAVKRILEEKDSGKFERIAALLAALLPPEERAWAPLLAAYLARCSPAEAAALAQAIAKSAS